MLPGTRPHIDEPVGGAHGVLVVLDDDHRIADVAQPCQRLEQALIVSLVQSDRRLIEDVQHANEARSDLRRQADALRLATGERRRRTIERQIADANVLEKRQAFDDLAEDPLGNQSLGLRQLERRRPSNRLLDRLIGGLVDRETTDGDGQALGLQTRAIALGAGPHRHPLFDAVFLQLRVGLVIPTLKARQQSLPSHRVGALAAIPVLVRDHDPLAVGTFHVERALSVCELAPRRVEVDLEALRDCSHQLFEEVRPSDIPGLQRSGVERLRRIGLNQRRIQLGERTQAVAVRTGAMGRVEREDARRQLCERHAVVGARKAFRERERLAVLDRDVEQTVGELQRGLYRVGQSPPLGRLLETIDDDGDVVIELLVEHDLVFQQKRLTIDFDAREAFATQPLKNVFELSLTSTHDRSVNRELRVLGQAKDLLDDLLSTLTSDGTSTDGTVRSPTARVEQAQVIVDLGDGADGRARITRRRLLVDRDCRREAIDAIDIGLLHLAEELAGIGAQRFDVASLPLGIERVEREAGLARPREARDADQFVAWENNGDVLEVMLAGTSDRDRLLSGHPDRLIAPAAEPAGGLRLGLRLETKRRVSVRRQQDRVGADAGCPTQRSHRKFKQATGVASGEENCEPRDQRHGQDCDPKEKDDDVVRDREEPFDQRHSARQILLGIWIDDHQIERLTIFGGRVLIAQKVDVHHHAHRER